MKKQGFFIFLLLLSSFCKGQTSKLSGISLSASIKADEIMADMKRVADWQLANPTGKELNSWEYGPFYIGLMALYNVSEEKKYLDEVKKMGDEVNWEPIARPYDANVLAISQAFLELYEINGKKYVIDKSRFVMDAPMKRELMPDITFDKNKYWWEWWSWCDALFMAPPAYARIAVLLNQPEYKDFMIKEWKRTSAYLYSSHDSLFFRDDRFFKMKSANGEKIFWSRGNGWVLGGLARVMQYLPKSDSSRKFFEQQFREMSYKLKRIQVKNGFWSQSLLDPENYPQKESSGTAFYVYAMSWGVNNGLLPADEFIPVIQKGWLALKESVHPDGKLGYVQEVGDSPTNVKFDDSETYGTGAFLLAGSELYKMAEIKEKKTAVIIEPVDNDRDFALNLLFRIADPVFQSLSKEKLHEVFPRKEWETRESNVHTSSLQAFGRILSGMAPWLSLGADSSDEGVLRDSYIKLARECLINATKPGSEDYLFGKPTQEIIVHAAYIAYPLLIAPEQLWNPLTKTQQKNVIDALKLHRKFKPNESNWLLFSALIETAIWKFTGECQMKPIKYAIKKHNEWYLGDGVYGDGPEFHWDYYNSYVIHPLLIEILRNCKELNMSVNLLYEKCVTRGERYAEILEHLISPEGTFPVIGRSSVYRIAVLQQLEYSAFRNKRLPASMNPGATRSAITTVIKRMMMAPGTFDNQGFLNAGIVGEQINARDYYNYTGALYMCTLGLTHLGIPPDNEFWTASPSKWTQQKIWDGENLSGQSVFK